jgi:hypothetical protein
MSLCNIGNTGYLSPMETIGKIDKDVRSMFLDILAHFAKEIFHETLSRNTTTGYEHKTISRAHEKIFLVKFFKANLS